MKKRILLTCLILTPLFLLGCSKTTDANQAEETVRLSFDNYKSAILNDKGEDAVNYLDANTIGYYSGILKLVKNANRNELSSLSLMDKLMVLIIRNKATKQEILSLDGKGLLVYAIKNWMVGKDSVMNNSIWEVSIDTDFAKGEMLVNGKKSWLYFQFHKETNSWKLDLTSIFPMSNAAIKKVADESGLSEDEFILSLIEYSSNKKPNANIWNPVK